MVVPATVAAEQVPEWVAVEVVIPVEQPVRQCRMVAEEEAM